MAKVSVTVPAVAVGPLRSSLIALYRASAESLYLALRAHAEGRRTLEELQDHRKRLAELEALLDSVGWDAATRAEELTAYGSAELLQDAAYGALIDAGERLAAACLRRGVEADGEGFHAVIQEVIQLDRLLQQTRA